MQLHYPCSERVRESERAPRHTEIAAAVESAHDAWYGVAEDGVGEGEFNSGVDIFEFQRMMHECVFMSVRWHRRTLAQDIDSRTETLTTMFMDGFGPAPRGVAGATGSTGSTTAPAPSDDIRAELDLLRTEVRAIREGRTPPQPRSRLLHSGHGRQHPHPRFP